MVDEEHFWTDSVSTYVHSLGQAVLVLCFPKVARSTEAEGAIAGWARVEIGLPIFIDCGSNVSDNSLSVSGEFVVVWTAEDGFNSGFWYSPKKAQKSPQTKEWYLKSGFSESFVKKLVMQ